MSKQINKSYHNSHTTDNLMSTYFPSWMKMSSDRDSVGWRMMNSIFGQDNEIIKDTLVNVRNNIYVDTAYIHSPSRVYITEHDINIQKATLSGVLDSNTSFDIRIVDNQDKLYINPPTRYEFSQSIHPTGLISGIIGLSFFSLPLSSGLFLINDNLAAEDLRSTVTYETHPVSGDITTINNKQPFGSGLVDFNNRGVDFILEPLSSGHLRKFYPQTRDITEIVNRKPQIATVLHYEPPEASGFSTYFELAEDGTKRYFLTALNNPFGSGTYINSTSTLDNVPLPGSVRIFDINYLDPSGNAYEINPTGQAVYALQSGNFNYRGYDLVVPDRFVQTEETKQFVGMSGTLQYSTSWEVLREGSFLDDEVPPHSGSFEFIVNPTGAFTNEIFFTNANSKYLVEYSFRIYEKSKNITTTILDHHVQGNTSNPIFTTDFVDYSGHIIPWEFCTTDINCIRVKPSDIRPGREASIHILYEDQTTGLWNNPSGSPFSINLVKKNMGYTEEIVESIDHASRFNRSTL